MADEQGMLEQFYQPAAIAERRISEERLDAALRNGIARGKQAKSRQRMKRITVSCAAAVLLMIGGAFAMNGLHFGNGIESASVHTAVNNQIPAYVNWSAGDKGMLREALDQGRYQVVEKTAAYEGYQVTVDGIVTDRKHLVLFYTSKSSNGDRITPEAPELFTSARDKLKYKLFVRNTNQLTGYYDEGSYHDMLVFDLTDESLPEEFYFASKWGNSEPGSAQKFLEIKIPVDTSKLAELERTMEVNKTLEFEGQKVKIKNVVQIPLRLNVNLAMDAANSKKIVTLPNWELYTKNNKGNVFPSTMVMKNSEQWKLGFYAPDYVQGELLGLRGSWIETEFKGDRRLILNTKEQKIVSAPDERIRLQGIEKKDGHLRITTAFSSLEPSLVQFAKADLMFTDGKGVTHSLLFNKETVHEAWRKDRAANLDLYYFDIESMSYPQPLTFDFAEYPGEFIKNPFDIVIQK
ncbi:DUF4179 domain-containing protein [Paenibacillus donghaensis]|uniref:DUF4179 domain-containing protein n=1 Tax=Paenibacillus donghaensis TaxID=414771 RepID=UPI001883831A|nr:DUF4179 domain-containing protein [Paenibacillus donghaensis]MBE9915804.1 DUF4179 domain-containing protein [Paenibacillus donghaensis]